MRLGIAFPLASTAEQVRGQIDAAVLAEDLGYDIAWVPEGYGADAVSSLGAIAARTDRIGIGSAVLQIPARSPASAAMTAAGLDAVSTGRFHLGLGVSGPQVSEGWHGVGFADPLGRTREYVALVRAALSRRRLTGQGPHFPLPLPGGAGKALALALAVERQEVPIYLAAVGPRNMELAGAIADGWLGVFFDQQDGAEQLGRMRAAVADAGRDPALFDCATAVPTALGDDPVSAGRQVRPYAALYLGGMGSRRTNFYHRLACQMGYEAEADQVQEHFLARDYERAAAAVPQEFLERTCLLGTETDIAAGLARLAAAGIDTVSINPGPGSAGSPDLLRTVAHAAAELGLRS